MALPLSSFLSAGIVSQGYWPCTFFLTPSLSLTYDSSHSPVQTIAFSVAPLLSGQDQKRFKFVRICYCFVLCVQTNESGSRRLFTVPPAVPKGLRDSMQADSAFF